MNTKYTELQKFIVSKVTEFLNNNHPDKLNLNDFASAKIMALTTRDSIKMYIRANFDYEELVELVTENEIRQIKP